MDQNLMFVLLGLVASVLTSLIKKENWSDKTKASLSTGLAFVAGVANVYLTDNNVDATAVLASWAATLGVSQAVFTYILKTTGLEKILAGIGSK